MAKPTTQDRLVGWLVLGGILFYLVSLYWVGAMTPGYEQSRRLISELGEFGAPYAWLWRTTIFSGGVVTLLLARSLHRVVGGSRSVWGPALVATIGVGLVLGGIFQCDPPACAPVTFSGWTHILTSIPATISALGGPFVFARRFRGDPEWRRYAGPSKLFGWLSIATIGAAFFAFPACGIPGVGQRVATFTQLAWLSMMAWALTRADQRTPA